ncbi:upper zone of growth plate and cartilage matrix associated a [Solea solea]|uniref:upper zone of growth plate and cartilage matrix associated a n=1 Tax=Solea solea TaxID=90069 RepID=UPI00272CFF0C|nr:upper zone of growth plate and cartilage matrix associated a [Solea solea]
MLWARVFVLSVLTTLLILTFSNVVENTEVPDSSQPADDKGTSQRVFMPVSDASNFFKRRNRRSSRYYEIQAEQRVKIAANERWREHNEEQRSRRENYAEEARDEINERTRETNEQVREYHYDGRYPRYYWSH